MKYIKQYEKLIKRTSNDAIYHELNKLADFFIDIFEKLKLIDRETYANESIHNDSYVKKNYSDNNSINIYYNILSGEKFKVATINIKKENNNIDLMMEMRKYKMDKNSNYIYDFIASKLIDYKMYNRNRLGYFKIPLTQELIIEKLMDINIYFDANKYNL